MVDAFATALTNIPLLYGMKRRHSPLSLILWSISLLMLTVQCARRGTPTGGPVDEAPPVLLYEDPPNYSRNFEGGVFRLEFDEFVKLKDANKQIVVSPPQKNKPIFRPPGGTAKYVEMQLMDTLQDNTTYSISFGQSIVDNNEENPFPFYTYVFSTGDVLDSLVVSGIVTDAYKRQVDPFVSIMMYRIDSTYTDSVPFLRLPSYIGSTSDSTSTFTIGNLRAGKYRVIAIKDNNTNNLFDPLSDRIGYVADTVVIPTEEPLLMKLFREVPAYRANTPSLIHSNKIFFGYLGEGDSLEIQPFPALPDSIRSRSMPVPDKDTVAFYLNESAWDTIQFLVKNPPLQRVDTFVVRNRKIPRDSLLLTANYKSTLPFNDSFQLLANTPVDSVDLSRISVFVNDSIPHEFKAEFNSIRNLLDIDFEKDPVTNYRIDLLPGTVTDFFGDRNDTLQYLLKTRSLADFGNLTLKLGGNPVFPLILQLTNEKDEPVNEIYSTGQSEFEFLNIDPGKYGVRIIYDRNGNREWDTGNYLQGIKPETVKYYPGYIELRANWEQIETFVLDPE